MTTKLHIPAAARKLRLLATATLADGPTKLEEVLRSIHYLLGLVPLYGLDIDRLYQDMGRSSGQEQLPFFFIHEDALLQRHRAMLQAAAIVPTDLRQQLAQKVWQNRTCAAQVTWWLYRGEFVPLTVARDLVRRQVDMQRVLGPALALLRDLESSQAPVKLDPVDIAALGTVNYG